MTVDIITIGKRSIYNPAHYQIKQSPIFHVCVETGID